MTEILGRITENIWTVYYIRQVLSVLVLFVIGLLVLSLSDGTEFKKDENTGRHISIEYKFLLAFPVGMALFSVCALVLLICNVKYMVFSIILVVSAVIITLIILSEKMGFVVNEFRDNRWKCIIYTGVVLTLILIAVSGIVSIGYSNDSMYYYSAYPHELVLRGDIYEGFDVFLTDCGQTTAIINTIPFMFGFNETFGIHTFFNFNLICFFAYAVYEKCSMYFDRKISTVTTLLSTLFLVTATPYMFVSKWIIANMYFMGYSFILLHLNNRFVNDESTIYVKSLLFIMLSFVRIEGALYAGLIMLVYMMQENIKKNNVIMMVMPAAVIQAFYYIKIFVFMHIKAIYTFMTWQKAIVAVAFLIAIIVYALFVSEDTKHPVIMERFAFVSPIYITFSGLIVVNAGLLVYDRGIFISNVKVFIGNVVKNSGWGFFAAVIVVMILLVPKTKIKTLYYEYFCGGFILVSFAACFARGDGLRVNLFDSSNRVMLQIVPFIVYALVNRYIETYATFEKNNT